MSDPAQNPRRGPWQKGQSGNPEGSKHKSRKTILKAALQNGDFENADWLRYFDELCTVHLISDADALALLRVGTDPDNRYLKFGHLAKALELKESLAAKIKAAKKPVVPAPVKLDGKQQAQILQTRNAILEGKTPVAAPEGKAVAIQPATKPIHDPVMALVEPKDEYKYRYARSYDWTIGYRVGGRWGVNKPDMTFIPAEQCRAILNIVVSPFPTEMVLVERADCPYWMDKRSIPEEETPEWLKQWRGFGTPWQWPEIPEPVVETPIPPSAEERIVLPPVVDGYVSQLPGEALIQNSVSNESVIAGFMKNRKFDFVETGHSGNSVMGTVEVKCAGLQTKTFPNIRLAHFKLWKEKNFVNESMPAEMREAYTLFVQTLQSIVLPPPRSTLPDIEPFLANGKPNPYPVRYTGGIQKARKWGTKADDAKKQPRRHVYGESLGTDLAQMYIDADKVKGFDL
jgi:hypothetical protein